MFRTVRIVSAGVKLICKALKRKYHIMLEIPILAYLTHLRVPKNKFSTEIEFLLEVAA